MQPLTRDQVAEKHRQVERIIASKQKAPIIVNKDSNFVVVTYWWGNENLNRNTARPCISFYEDIYKPAINLLVSLQDISTFREKLDASEKFTQMIEKKGRDYIGVVKNELGPLQGGAENNVDPLNQGLGLNAMEERAIRLANRRNPTGPLNEPLHLEELQERGRKNPLFVNNIRTPADFAKIMKETLYNLTESPELSAELIPLITTYNDIIRRRNQLAEEASAALARQDDVTVERIKREVEAIASEKSKAYDAIKKFIAANTYPKLDSLLRYKEQISYKKMIQNWEQACKKNKTNYLAIEYPEFAERGGYQLAINAKPRFIQKALELCAPRGVLYIDGDMTINRYPDIFDTPDVDMMARGWSIDPRSSHKHTYEITVDPYNFETSGGTMFFGQTPEARKLLDVWIEVSEMYSQWGKADDRILSLVFNAKKLLLPMKIIQLPIEYLWLTLDYDDNIEEELWDREKIYIEHPECLTSEDTAGGAGASSDRTPKFYAGIENIYPRSETLFEYVMFPNQKLRESFGPYLNYMKGAKYFDDKMDDCLYGRHPFEVVAFGDRYGKKLNAVAAQNEKYLELLVKEPQKLRNMFGHNNNFMPTDAEEGEIMRRMFGYSNNNFVNITEEERLRHMFGHNNNFMPTNKEEGAIMRRMFGNNNLMPTNKEEGEIMRRTFGNNNNNFVPTAKEEGQIMRRMFGNNNEIQSGGVDHIADTMNMYVPGQGLTHVVRESKYEIAEILYGLMKLKKTVLYIPKTSKPEYIRSVKNCLTDPKYARIEFAFVNASKDVRDTFFFQSQVDYTQPILFRPGSIQLLHLLRISENVASLAKFFKNGYQFLSRIRTHYMVPVKENGANQAQAGGSMSENVELSILSEKAIDMMYGNSKPQAGGSRYKRKQTRRKHKVRKYKTRKH
jgi:hypothetical protein